MSAMQDGKKSRTAGLLPPGFDSFNVFGVPNEPVELPMRSKVQQKLESMLGSMGGMHTLDPYLKDKSLSQHVEHRFWYFLKKRSWYIYVDQSKPLAAKLGLKIQKNLVSPRNLDSSHYELRDKALYVGSNDGEITRLPPIKGADESYMHVAARYLAKQAAPKPNKQD